MARLARTTALLATAAASCALAACHGASPNGSTSSQSAASSSKGGTAPTTTSSTGTPSPSPSTGPSPSPAPSTSPQPGPSSSPIPQALVKGAPRVFYTDLESGPSSGGANGKGVFVALYGAGFGATQGNSTVTIGGGSADNYPIWSDKKVCIQLGAAAQTGNIVLHGPGGDSNALPFTVRTGNIYFVGPNGSDMAAGTFAAPWATLSHAVDTVQPGDTIYALDGTVQNTQHNYTACLSIQTAGTQAMPIGLIAYPGATVKVGNPTLMGIRVPNINVTGSYWVVAGLTISGQNEAISLGDVGALGWRIIANDCSAPTGTGLTGAVTTGLANGTKFFGNNVHNCGLGDTKFYHAVYFSTDTNHVECAWNWIHDNNCNRSIQFHSSPLGGATGFNMYDLSVHDNVIQGSMGDGINFATVDPSQGKVEAYNNVIYRVGLGGPAASQIFSLSGVYVAGATNMGNDGTGVVEVYNNTLYDVGGGVDPSGNPGVGGAFSRAAGASPALKMNLRNNVVHSLNQNESYIVAGSDTTLITGSNNLFFGAGAAPSFLGASLTSDPLFTNATGFDFHPKATSPAIDAGVNTAIVWDLDGNPRPQGAGYDIGAYEVK